MKLQLTKTKTIEIALPGRGGAKSSSDMTGVELFPVEGGECPAVRLTYRKKEWHLSAAGRVKAPDGELPARWEDTPHQPVWELPREFLSPHAAIAVNSPLASFTQSTVDAIVQDMSSPMPVANTTSEPKTADGTKRRFGIKRNTEAAPSAAPAAPAKSAASAHKAEFPKAGEPVSENGRRFTVRPMVEDGFHLCASLPEFQTLWISRLLPEGKRPTASSIQLAESALMASVMLQPAFRAAEGNALAIFVQRHSIHFAGYRKGEPVLWRKCPTAGGALDMRSAVKRTLGIEENLVDSVLNESLIDPRPALEPFARPILAQLELALAYLTGKHGMKFDSALLMGLTAGAGHLSALTEEALHLKLLAPDPFDGLVLDKGVGVPDATSYLVALGAAVAGTEATL